VARAEVWNRMWGQVMVRNVTRPTLTPVLPASGKASGAAVIVVPGGAFLFASMQNEGWPIARRLADQGVAAFVLKYRMDATPDDDAQFAALVGARFAGASRPGGGSPSLHQPLATADVQEALRLVRARAGEFGIDPDRIGLLGFSAGAIASMEAVLANRPEARPAFLGYVYGPMSAVQAPADAPPMFAALAMDDPLFGRSGFGIVDAWKAVKRPVELHVYERGGHGFGMGPPGTTAALWLDQFVAWLRARPLLTPMR
jgi:acetyl esterase/lipase